MIRDDIPEPEHTLPGLFDQPARVTVRHGGPTHKPAASNEIPFMQRPTCTIKEACKAAGMGRSKLYELIKDGELQTTSVGRRRLVQVPSLLKFLRVLPPDDDAR
jgi:excisionase family DNA binding protein